MRSLFVGRGAGLTLTLGFSFGKLWRVAALNGVSDRELGASRSFKARTHSELRDHEWNG